MLQPIRHKLQAQKIVLASSSPRRKQVLEIIGLQFEVKDSKFEENLDKASFPHPSEYAIENAKQKALAVVRALPSNTGSHLVIGADTVVALGNQIYEKPKSKEDAVQMLSKFSGTKHTVYTGIALVQQKGLEHSEEANPPPDVTTFYEATDVYMGDISLEVIESYVDTGEPMDKAGSYGIQGIGASLIESIQGDFYNVMGFPLYRFCYYLNRIMSEKA